MKSILCATLAGASLVGLAAIGSAAPASAQGRYVPCAPENGYCRVPYPTQVFYGARGRGTTRNVDGRGIPCSNDVFGDPLPGIPKSCAYLDRGGGRDRDWDRRDNRRGGDWDRRGDNRRGGDWDDRPRRRQMIEDDDF